MHHRIGRRDRRRSGRGPPRAQSTFTGQPGESAIAFAAPPESKKSRWSSVRTAQLLSCQTPTWIKSRTVVSMTGYGNAGQTCISTQRVLAAKKVYGDFLGAAEAQSRSIDAQAINSTRNRKSDRWSKRAKRCGSISGSTKLSAAGARLVAGGGRRGAIYLPAIVADVHPDMRISRDELFGPAVAVTPFDTHRRSYRSSQRQHLWTSRRHIHRKRRMGDEICPRSGSRQSARQLGLAMARRSHALRRSERLRFRQRRTQIRCAGNDRIEDGGISFE